MNLYTLGGDLLPREHSPLLSPTLRLVHTTLRICSYTSLKAVFRRLASFCVWIYRQIPQGLRGAAVGLPVIYHDPDGKAEGGSLEKENRLTCFK